MDRLSRRLVATFLTSLPQTRSRRWSHTSSLTPIQAFFARYPQFSYDPSKDTMVQFKEMASQLKWERAIRRKALVDIQGAMAQQFDKAYGVDAGNLHDAQKLCKVVGRRKVPNNIHACKMVLGRVHVNIWDVVDYPATEVLPPIHSSETALSKYTRLSGKFYPKEDAQGFLKLLLRNIRNPSRNRGRVQQNPSRTKGRVQGKEDPNK